eukprot:COSAG02_NODE_34152_length_488_cov_10.454855_1_plen_117_part_10
MAFFRNRRFQQCVWLPLHKERDMKALPRLKLLTLRQVLAELTLDPVVGPLWATKGFGFFEMMFRRFEHGAKVCSVLSLPAFTGQLCDSLNFAPLRTCSLSTTLILVPLGVRRRGVGQ